MGSADPEDHADVGPDHVGEVADVADAGGTHLDHEVAGVDAGLENGERYADLAVVGALRRNGCALRGEDPRQQVLGGGLAGGTGNAHHRQRLAGGGAAGTDPADGFRGEGTHGQHRVPDHDGGVIAAGVVGDVALDERQDGAALEGGGDEVVAVGASPPALPRRGSRVWLPGNRSPRSRG